MTHASSVSHARTRSRAARIASLARLEQTEDWDTLTAAANATANHPRNLDYWRAKIRAVSPRMHADRVDHLAEAYRSQYFTDLANKRWHPEDSAKRTDCGCGSAGHGPDECPESAPERAA